MLVAYRTRKGRLAAINDTFEPQCDPKDERSSMRFRTRSVFEPNRVVGRQRRSQVRKFLIETLERRDLMASVPVAIDDPRYTTPVSTDLVISNAVSGLVSNDFEVNSAALSASVVANTAHGSRPGWCAVRILGLPVSTRWQCCYQLTRSQLCR